MSYYVKFTCDSNPGLNIYSEVFELFLQTYKFLNCCCRPFQGLPEGVTVVRSVSDAVENAPSGGKYASLRRSNGFLRRPEILETVYSVEEDPDADPASGSELTNPENQEDTWAVHKGRLKELYGSFERLDQEPPNHVTTYNRVMSNHRSVTKPKDVKYKRINKAKSKSLEELRGRLKNWVEKGNKLAVSLDQSFA